MCECRIELEEGQAAAGSSVLYVSMYYYGLDLLFLQRYNIKCALRLL